EKTPTRIGARPSGGTGGRGLSTAGCDGSTRTGTETRGAATSRVLMSCPPPQVVTCGEATLQSRQGRCHEANGPHGPAGSRDSHHLRDGEPRGGREGGRGKKRGSHHYCRG